MHDCSIRIYHSFKQVFMRTSVPSENLSPSKFYDIINCTCIAISNSSCAVKLNSVLGSCGKLNAPKFY